MRSAPSVNYPVGRSYWGVLPVLIIALLGLTSLAVWWATTHRNGMATWAGLTAACLWVAWLVWQLRVWLRSPVGEISWRFGSKAEGAVPGVLQEGWYWMPAGRPLRDALPLKEVRVVFDFQSLMLVMVRTAEENRTLHFWIASQQSPPEWRALRSALMAHAR